MPAPDLSFSSTPTLGFTWNMPSAGRIPVMCAVPWGGSTVVNAGSDHPMSVVRRARAALARTGLLGGLAWQLPLQAEVEQQGTGNDGFPRGVDLHPSFRS